MNDNNQLDSVTCQIKFPALLEIHQNIHLFQNTVLNEYPDYTTITEGGPSNLPPIANHRFASSDGLWWINVTNSFIALSTSDYRSWMEFMKRLDKIMENFFSCYNIHKTTRIGIRYINAIRPSILKNLEKMEVPDDMDIWRQLIDERYISPLTGEDDPKGFGATIEYGKGDITVRSTYGLIQFSDGPSEQGFLIDNDVFTMTEYSIKDYGRVLSELHSESRAAFSKMTSKLMKEAVGFVDDR